MSSRLTAKQTHKKTHRVCQVLITTHMSEASRWENSRCLRVHECVNGWVLILDLEISCQQTTPPAPVPSPFIADRHSAVFFSHAGYLGGGWVAAEQNEENSNMCTSADILAASSLKQVAARRPHITHTRAFAHSPPPFCREKQLFVWGESK